MIISFNGTEGSGKTTIADKVAYELGYPKYSMGKIFRNLAEERGLSLSDFQKLCEKDPQTDKETDDYLVSLSKKEKNFVVESRTAWHFIPDSIKIYLKAEPQEAAKRILKNIQKESDRKKEAENMNSLDGIIKSEASRKARDDERYRKYYGIDIHNEKNYDFVLDTTNLSIEEVFDGVMQFIRKKI